MKTRGNTYDTPPPKVKNRKVDMQTAVEPSKVVNKVEDEVQQQNPDPPPTDTASKDPTRMRDSEPSAQKIVQEILAADNKAGVQHKKSGDQDKDITVSAEASNDVVQKDPGSNDKDVVVHSTSDSSYATSTTRSSDSSSSTSSRHRHSKKSERKDSRHRYRSRSRSRDSSRSRRHYDDRSRSRDPHYDSRSRSYDDRRDSSRYYDNRSRSRDPHYDSRSRSDYGAYDRDRSHNSSRNYSDSYSNRTYQNPSGFPPPPPAAIRGTVAQPFATAAAFDADYDAFLARAIDSYGDYFPLDRDTQHFQVYIKNMEIIYSKYRHDKGLLERERKVFLHSIRPLVSMPPPPRRNDDPEVQVSEVQEVEDSKPPISEVQVSEVQDVKDSKPRASSKIASGGNGDDPSDGSTSVETNEGDYRKAAWEPKPPYHDTQYTLEIQQLRRAFYLCEVPDDYHVGIITFGGINTIEAFAHMTMSKWRDLAKSLVKKPGIVLNPKHQRLLVALSLWARVRIYHGNHKDFDSLTRKGVVDIADRNVCVQKATDSIDLVEFKDIKQFVPWRQSFAQYLSYSPNEDDIPLSYVIRAKTPPPTFSNLMEELQYLIPVDMSNAIFRRDSNKVFALLKQVVLATLARPHITHKKSAKDQNGRAVFLSLCDFLEGENAKARKISEAEEAIRKLVWSNNPTFSPEAFTSKLLKYFNQLEEEDEPWDDRKKIRTMRLSILPNNPEIVAKTAWINNVKEKLEEMGDKWTFEQAVQHFNEKGRQNCKKPKRGISAVNGKKGKGSKSKKSRGSGEADTNDRGYKDSGEPTRDIINGVDISPLRQLKAMIPYKQYQRLPHIVRDYISKNYLPKIKNKKDANTTPTYPSKKAKKSAIRKLKKKISSIQSATVGGDDDTPSSDSDSDDDQVTTTTSASRKT